MTRPEEYDQYRVYDRNPGGSKSPQVIVVIGCGGVGSWVAYLLALAGANRIYLVDHDRVETTNLNRCPFKPEHVGRYKVEVIGSLITEYRPHADVVAIPSRIEDLDTYIIDMLSGAGCIIDCRDIGSPLPGKLRDKGIITGGYDGFNATIDIDTHPHGSSPKEVYIETRDAETGKSTYSSLDMPVAYRTTPSYVIPPVVIASMIVNYLCVEIMHSSFNGKFTIPMNFKNVLGTLQYATEKRIEDSIKRCENV